MYAIVKAAVWKTEKQSQELLNRFQKSFKRQKKEVNNHYTSEKKKHQQICVLWKHLKK